MPPSPRPPLVDALRTARRRALPIASFPGAQLTGATVLDLATSATAQTEAILALNDRLRLPALLTCMDLSVEAEAFGAATHFGEDEVPTIHGRHVTTLAEAENLPVPRIGTARTAIQPEVIRNLVRARPELPVVAGATGPFSLAARLLGTTESMVLTLQDPALVQAVLERVVCFMRTWLTQLRDAGASAVFMAEPTAGLLSPRGLATFSTEPVRAVTEGLDSPAFRVILHNCAARPVHLPAIAATGLSAFHFGAPMDLEQALTSLLSESLVLGNLDPTAVFLTGTPDSVAAAFGQLHGRLGLDPRWVPSSGCDIPRRCALGNLEAFLEAVEQPTQAAVPVGRESLQRR